MNGVNGTQPTEGLCCEGVNEAIPCTFTALTRGNAQSVSGGTMKGVKRATIQRKQEEQWEVIIRGCQWRRGFHAFKDMMG